MATTAFFPSQELRIARKMQQNVLKASLKLMELERKLRTAEERYPGGHLVATTREGRCVSIRREELEQYKRAWRENAVDAMRAADVAAEWDRAEETEKNDDGDPGLISQKTADTLATATRNVSISWLLAFLELESARAGEKCSRSRQWVRREVAMHLGLPADTEGGFVRVEVARLRSQLRRRFRRATPTLSKTLRRRYLRRRAKGESPEASALGAGRCDSLDELKGRLPALWVRAQMDEKVCALIEETDVHISSG